MAARIMLVFASLMILNTFSSQVFAANKTTPVAPTSTVGSNQSTTAPTDPATTPPKTTTQIKPTPTTTTVASATVSPGFVTTLKVSATYKGECGQNKTTHIKKAVQELYKEYNIKGSVDIVGKKSGTHCMVNITVQFDKGLTKYDVIEKFENSSRKAIGGVSLTLIDIGVKVEGVTLGKYKPSEDDCKAKCCNTGGPIDLERTCQPKYKCKNYKLMKTVKDCSKECDANLCSAGVSVHFSLVILVFGGLLNWILKE